MKGKNIINRIIATTLAAAMCFSLCGFIGTASAAALTDKEITMSSGVKIYVETYAAGEDGEIATTATRYIPQNASYENVTPFIVEDANGGGTTYLPLRAIALLYGVGSGSIAWDDATKTANLTNVTTGTNQSVTNPNPTKSNTTTYTTTKKNAAMGVTVKVNGSEYICKDANGNTVSSYLIDGTTYFPIRALSVLFLGNLTADEMKNYIEWKADATGENAVFIKDAKGLAAAQGLLEELKDEEGTDFLTLIKNMLAKNDFLGLLGTGFDTINTVKSAIKAAISVLPLTKFITELTALQREAVTDALKLSKDATDAQIVMALQTKLYDLIIANPITYLGKALDAFLKGNTTEDPSDPDAPSLDFLSIMTNWIKSLNPFKNLGSFTDLSSLKAGIEAIINKLPGGSIITGMTNAQRNAFIDYLGIEHAEGDYSNVTDAMILTAMREKAFKMVTLNPMEFLGKAMDSFISILNPFDKKGDETTDKGVIGTIIDTIKDKVDDMIVTPGEAVTKVSAGLEAFKKLLGITGSNEDSILSKLNPLNLAKKMLAAAGNIGFINPLELPALLAEVAAAVTNNLTDISGMYTALTAAFANHSINFGDLVAAMN